MMATRAATPGTIEQRCAAHPLRIEPGQTAREQNDGVEAAAGQKRHIQPPADRRQMQPQCDLLQQLN